VGYELDSIEKQCYTPNMRIKIGDMMFNNAKLGELILYVSQLCEKDRKFGATKLNKILFYCDFLSYLNYGKAITEDEYQAIEKGPAPKHLIPIREKLIEEEALAIKNANYYGFVQNRTVALRDPDLSLFTPQEIDLVNRIVHELCDHDGRSVSKLSHMFSGYMVASENEIIPYETALLDFDSPTEEMIKYGRSLENFAKSCLNKEYGDS